MPDVLTASTACLSSGSRVGEDEFYFGCQCLKIPVTDGRARYLFQGQCKESAILKSLKSAVTELDFDRFIIWATRHVCFTLKHGEPPETDMQRRARQGAEMSKELENLAGEYGDIHFVDLMGVLTKKRSSFGEKELSPMEKRRARIKAKMKKAVKSSLECSELVKKGIEFSTKQNDGFPNLTENGLRMMVRMCVKEEYFSGQNIITQGEVDARYYVLRRGRVDVIISETDRDSDEPTESKVTAPDPTDHFPPSSLYRLSQSIHVYFVSPCLSACVIMPACWVGVVHWV
jgi:hypothetical protein